MFITDLVITNPPQDNVVCVGDEVNITCGYNFSVLIPPIWRINQKAYSPSDIMNHTMFESPMVTNSMDIILTVYTTHEMRNQTTFRCEFQLLLPVSSSVGRLTLMGKMCIQNFKGHNYHSCLAVVKMLLSKINDYQD